MTLKMPPLRLLTLSALTLACAGAMAQSNNAPVQTAPGVQAPGNSAVSSSASAVPGNASQSPYYLGVQQGLSYESNVRGAWGSQPKIGDWFSTTTLRAGVNQPISRQRFFADASLRYNRYNDRSELNNTGYSLAAGWDWATVERLSGVVTVYADQNLTRPTMTAGQRNIERSNELNAVARIGGVTALTFEVGANMRQVDHSNVSFALSEYSRTGVHGAVLYRLSSATTLGFGVAGAQSTYPFNGDKSNRRDAYVQGSWTPSGLTDVQARLAQTKMSYDILTARDYTGVTGSLVVNWRPSGKVATSLFAARDTGGEIGFLRLTPDANVSSANTSTISNMLGARATYELSAKVLVDLGLSWQRRTLVNLFTAGLPGASAPGSDTLTVFQVGSRWSPTRNISVGCQVSREMRNTRTTALDGSQSSSNPANDIFGCFGAYTIY
jgi:hypothetical protein